MVVTLRTTETTDEVVLQWHSTEVGDAVENANGVRSSHPTKLVEGRVRLQIADEPPEEFEAPHTFILPTKTPYTFTSLTPGAMICTYSKSTGAADEIRHLVTSGTVVFS